MQTNKPSKIKFGLLQLDIEWENVSENLEQISKILKDSNLYFDILVLPEMFATGFSMSVKETAQTMEGKVVSWMKQQSQLRNIAIMGTLAVSEDGKCYNRAVYVNKGELSYYDKRHLFSMGDENNYFTAGNKRLIFDFKGIQILPIICYDLRFPVWMRNKNDYDIAVCMANWPKPRIAIWDILLQARAVENQCYTIGVNRVGSGGGLLYNGNSAVIDAKGQIVTKMTGQQTTLQVVELDIVGQDNFRAKFAVLNDSDDFNIVD